MRVLFVSGRLTDDATNAPSDSFADCEHSHWSIDSERGQWGNVGSLPGIDWDSHHTQLFILQTAQLIAISYFWREAKIYVDLRIQNPIAVRLHRHKIQLRWQQSIIYWLAPLWVIQRQQKYRRKAKHIELQSIGVLAHSQTFSWSNYLYWGAISDVYQYGEVNTWYSDWPRSVLAVFERSWNNLCCFITACGCRLRQLLFCLERWRIWAGRQEQFEVLGLSRENFIHGIITIFFGCCPKSDGLLHTVLASDVSNSASVEIVYWKFVGFDRC